jgi:hypothetical protein
MINPQIANSQIFTNYCTTLIKVIIRNVCNQNKTKILSSFTNLLLPLAFAYWIVGRRQTNKLRTEAFQTQKIMLQLLKYSTPNVTYYGKGTVQQDEDGKVGIGCSYK